MNKEYDAITAFHYAAYRPALHRCILKMCLGDRTFSRGLDIGSGTGQSAIALADFCHAVVGIDPSADIISKGIPHTNVKYSFFDETHIDFEDSTFGIMTLAGSLWYAKSQKLLNEIARVGTKSAEVLVYDFEIILKDILTKIGFFSRKNPTGSYNHEEDFSGLDTRRLTLIEKKSDKVRLQISSSDLAHLLLAVKDQYTSLTHLYGSDKLYDKIVDKLNSISDSTCFDIRANTFATVYHLN